ncbi:MAG: hypothetical protein B6244_08960 [Candidatus Cloacimonetes bacterium 4572_55]|nr:MAG: hypothetical protein B6244_08960 [Candidatus Cloacimonetes bacterium 4572_55]
MRLSKKIDGQIRVIGMVHLSPLPGSPRFGGSIAQIEENALRDARLLVENGVDGLMIENFGDAPFYKDRVRSHTIALIARIAWQIRELTNDMPIGINVLRNHAAAAIGIASAVGASFVRVNIHTGAMLTDQGVIEGRAAQTMRYRREIGCGALVMADVAVKHATRLGEFTLEDIARDTAYRGCADALILSGAGTGLPTSPESARRVKQAVPDRPIWIGSGVNVHNLEQYAPMIDGAIVGTEFKIDALTTNPVDPKRVAAFIKKIRNS